MVLFSGHGRSLAILVRPGQHVFLRSGAAHRAGLREHKRAARVEAVSSRADLLSAARHQRFAVQRKSRAWSLHVARPRASLCEVWPLVATAERFSSQQRACGSRRVRRRDRRLGAAVRACCLLREFCRGEAMQIGIFGAPSYVVSGELFFGQDRLEDAVGWASQ